jgi:MFS family permease
MKQRFNFALGAIVCEGLLSRLSFGVIGFALPLYARHLGMSFAQIGVLIALNSAVALAFKPLLGWAGDRFGLKRTFVAAISLRSLISLLLGFAVAPWELFAIRGMYGVSMSLRDPSANMLIAENGGKKAVASAFAWYQTARTVANSLSKALAGILLTITLSNYSLVFLVAFALSVLPLLVVLLFVHEPKGEHEENPDHQTAGERSGSTPKPQKPPVFRFAGLGFLIAGTAEMLSGLFPVIATEYAHLTKAQAGIVYTISTLITIVAGPVFGWLADHVSNKLVLAVRSVANTLSSLLYLIVPSFIGIGVARSVDDMGKAAFRPAWGALMAQISGTDKANRARTMSWLSMGEDAGGVAAPILAGLLWNTWGIAALMTGRIVMAIVTEIYAMKLERVPQAQSLSIEQKPRSRPLLARKRMSEG